MVFVRGGGLFFGRLWDGCVGFEYVGVVDVGGGLGGRGGGLRGRGGLRGE